MPHPLLIVSQLDYLIKIVEINSHTEWQTVKIQISWLFQKPADLDLHCVQRQGISRFSLTRIKSRKNNLLSVTSAIKNLKKIFANLIVLVVMSKII